MTHVWLTGIVLGWELLRTSITSFERLTIHAVKVVKVVKMYGMHPIKSITSHERYFALIHQHSLLMRNSHSGAFWPRHMLKSSTLCALFPKSHRVIFCVRVGMSSFPGRTYRLWQSLGSKNTHQIMSFFATPKVWWKHESSLIWCWFTFLSFWGLLL